MKSHVGWALIFASVTCLQGYIRWDLFVFRAQPLDTSPLGLCQHNKTLLPLNCLSVPYLSLRFPQHFLGDHLGLQKWWLVTSLVTGVHPLDQWEKFIRSQWTAWSRGGICSPGELGWRPRIHNETQWGTGTNEGREASLIRLVRTQVWIQTCLRRQKGRLITS
jgi:hypothetical protein